MRKFIIQFMVLAVISACGIAEGVVYDLASDWSDIDNPNGCWSLNYNNTAVSNHFYSSGQGYWGAYTSLDGSFSKSINDKSGNDWKTGDVVIHALSQPYGGNSTFTNVTWTAPSDGFISVSGRAWDAYIYSGRNVSWSLDLEGIVLAQKTDGVYGLDRTDTAAQISANTVSPGILDNLFVQSGDVLKFTAKTMTYYGHFMGLDMQVNFVPEPATIVLLALGAGLTIRRRRV